MLQVTATPVGVRAISIKGAGLFGIHEKTGSLYFDGKEVAIKKKLELNWYELLLAVMAAPGAFGAFVLELGKVAGWWGLVCHQIHEFW